MTPPHTNARYRERETERSTPNQPHTHLPHPHRPAAPRSHTSSNSTNTTHHSHFPLRPSTPSFSHLSAHPSLYPHPQRPEVQGKASRKESEQSGREKQAGGEQRGGKLLREGAGDRERAGSAGRRGEGKGGGDAGRDEDLLSEMQEGGWEGRGGREKASRAADTSGEGRSRQRQAAINPTHRGCREDKTVCEEQGGRGVCGRRKRYEEEREGEREEWERAR